MDSLAGDSFEDQRFREVPGPEGLREPSSGGAAARTPGVGTCSARYINAGATVGFCLVMSLKYTAPVGSGAVMPPGPPGIGPGQPRLLEHVSVVKVFVSRTPSSTLVTTNWSGEMPSKLSGARVQRVPYDLAPPTCYERHVAALGSEPPVADAAWLVDALEGLAGHISEVLERPAPPLSPPP